MCAQEELCCSLHCEYSANVAIRYSHTKVMLARSVGGARDEKPTFGDSVEANPQSAAHHEPRAIRLRAHMVPRQVIESLRTLA